MQSHTTDANEIRPGSTIRSNDIGVGHLRPPGKLHQLHVCFKPCARIRWPPTVFLAVGSRPDLFYAQVELRLDFRQIAAISPIPTSHTSAVAQFGETGIPSRPDLFYAQVELRLDFRRIAATVRISPSHTSAVAQLGEKGMIIRPNLFYAQVELRLDFRRIATGGRISPSETINF